MDVDGEPACNNSGRCTSLEEDDPAAAVSMCRDCGAQMVRVSPTRWVRYDHPDAELEFAGSAQEAIMFGPVRAARVPVGMFLHPQAKMVERPGDAIMCAMCRGGGRVSSWIRVPTVEEMREPEDWVVSCTTAGICGPCGGKGWVRRT